MANPPDGLVSWYQARRPGAIPGRAAAGPISCPGAAPPPTVRTQRDIQPREAAIAELTPKQRSHLRSLAHPLRPHLRIGKEGLTESAERVIRDALGLHELLKVKVLEGSSQPARELAAALAARIGDTEVIQVVGRTFVLYRPHPESPKLQGGFPRA